VEDAENEEEGVCEDEEEGVDEEEGIDEEEDINEEGVDEEEDVGEEVPGLRTVDKDEDASTDDNVDGSTAKVEEDCDSVVDGTVEPDNGEGNDDEPGGVVEEDLGSVPVMPEVPEVIVAEEADPELDIVVVVNPEVIALDTNIVELE